MLTGEKEMDSIVPSGATAGQNMTVWNRRKTYSGVIQRVLLGQHLGELRS